LIKGQTDAAPEKGQSKEGKETKKLYS